MRYIFEKLKQITEKHTKICLIILFIVGIVIYGIISKAMTNPMFLTNDEELYVNMARSFFFDHNFSRGYELINYSCIIYSVILSFAYFLYSPENIVFIMRIIGVIAMISSIFPVYLLTKEILNSKTKAIGMAALTLIIPEMVSSVYLIQENVSYPMFLWIAYFIYKKFKHIDTKNIKIDIAILLLFALIFFTKSYTIIFAISYFLFLFLEILKKKEYKKIKGIILQGLLFCLLIVIGLLIINSINGFEEGTNHYSTQILSIFPIDLAKIRIYYIWNILLYTLFYILYGSATSPYTNFKYKTL